MAASNKSKQNQYFGFVDTLLGFTHGNLDNYDKKRVLDWYHYVLDDDIWLKIGGALK